MLKISTICRYFGKTERKKFRKSVYFSK